MADTMRVPFNGVVLAGNELEYIRQSIEGGIAGNSKFTGLCHEILNNKFGSALSLLTTSCTSALEMSAILMNFRPGDEVIMPSFTFSSTANAFVLRGAVPVFVDIRPDTQNINEALIEQAITPRTRAICVVHYAGVPCEMETIQQIAQKYGLPVIEDAAQAISSSYRGRLLGSLGALGCLSFHETKNIVAGEGGALLVNDPAFADRAEIIWEKGTNRVKFKRGMVDKYTWVDVGSSYLPGDIIAAFLYAQLQSMDEIISRRRAIWQHYHAGLAQLEAEGLLVRPVVPDECEANGHIYYVLASDEATRRRWAEQLAASGVDAFMHYVPLHSSPAGRRFGRVAGPMRVTDSTSSRLLRLPLYPGLVSDQVEYVIETMRRIAVSDSLTV